MPSLEKGRNRFSRSSLALRKADFRVFCRLGIPFQFNSELRSLEALVQAIEAWEAQLSVHPVKPLKYVSLRRISEPNGNSANEPLTHRAKQTASAHSTMLKLSASSSFTLPAISNLHRKLVPKLQGHFRQIDVVAYSPSGRKMFDLPSAHLVPELLEVLELWLVRTETWPVWLRAPGLHSLLISIHPFVDGNGRLARLCEEWLLLDSKSPVARCVPAETALMLKWRPYFLADQKSRRENSLNSFSAFILKNYLSVLEAHYQEN